MMREVKQLTEAYQIARAKERNKEFKSAEQRVVRLEARPRNAKNER